MRHNAAFDATLLAVFYRYVAEFLGAHRNVSVQNGNDGVDSIAELYPKKERGAAQENRTLDLLITSEMLYQLS